MTLALIVAAARNRVIGLNNAMPWHLPADLRYFKQVTLGKPVIMGRNTFESIGRPLPGRDNIVVTRNPAFEAAGVSVVHSLEEALALGSRLLSEQGRPEAELMLIGGAQLYVQAMPLADRLYITEVAGRRCLVPCYRQTAVAGGGARTPAGLGREPLRLQLLRA